MRIIIEIDESPQGRNVVITPPEQPLMAAPSGLVAGAQDAGAAPTSLGAAGASSATSSAPGLMTAQPGGASAGPAPGTGAMPNE